MKNNNKGFTLVELLAVIVILAVVILIAVTAVIPRMNSAKKNAFLDEVKVYTKATDDIDLEYTNSTQCVNISEVNSRYVSKSDNSNYSGALYVFTDGSYILSLTNGKYYVITSDEPSIDEIKETRPSNFIDSCSSSTQFNYITYNANGGMGTMKSQTTVPGAAVTLNTSKFSKTDRKFAKWNTMPDGSGQDYYAGQKVNGLTSSGSVTLYALWATEKFESLAETQFTGSNNINTNIYLFTEENYEKDFEISFDIVNRSSFTSYDTYVNAMDESGTPYPGIAYRRTAADRDNFVANTNASLKASKNYTPDNTKSVKILRRDNKIYFAVNGATPQMLLNMEEFATPFNVPVTFGSSMKNGSAFRYVKATLKNMRVYVME